MVAVLAEQDIMVAVAVAVPMVAVAVVHTIILVALAVVAPAAQSVSFGAPEEYSQQLVLHHHN
jgi:hypothetical protein